MKYLILLLCASLCSAGTFEGIPIPDTGAGLPNYLYAAKVISNYDGDSVTLDIDQGFSNWRHDEKVRLYGINAPEIIGEEKEKGLAAKAFLADLLAKPWKRVYIRTIKDKREKFGRYLGILLLEAEDGTILNVNQALVDAGHAVIKHYP